MDLFDHNREKTLSQTAPLAARMRPRTLDEFIGQAHIVGPGRLLRRAIQADQLSSLIFYGPPGTGKTTLARIIANTTHAHFIAINAVLAGVKNIRESISVAQDKMGMFGQRTILFVDEVHRFNKAQQDALLPHVENGIVILIGATTENPYFEVNKALVSRSRIFELNPLQNNDLYDVARQALQDTERGYGDKKINVEPAALDHLVNVANGDARALLNALELAVETSAVDKRGIINITTAVAEESIQQRAVLYDKDGDAHFDTISAFIKSLRGSDPDAALYWLAKMVYAGEDPRFIFRRMLILAGEDVGLADPNALNVVVSAARAFDYVGLPEGQFHLTTACLYLATCPKSNSTLAYFDALEAVRREREADVPNHLKDANRDGDEMGHGRGYLYPHAYRDHWVAQQYLPETLQGKTFFDPSEEGYEATIHTQVLQRREAQLAAILEPALEDPLGWATNRLGDGPKAQTVWLQRTLGNVGQALSQTRHQIFALAAVERHHLVLDLKAGSGLLTWEAVRRANVGGVWSVADSAQAAAALQQQSKNLQAMTRPTIITGALTELPALLANHPEAPPAFDILLGRNIFTQQGDRVQLSAQLHQHLSATGRLVLAETIPQQTQRLYKLVNLQTLPTDLQQRLIAAEEAIYQNPDDPMVNFTAETLVKMLRQAGFSRVEAYPQAQPRQIQITETQLQRWFSEPATPPRPTYAQHLRHQLSSSDVAKVGALIRRQLLNQVVEWHSQLVYLQAWA